MTAHITTLKGNGSFHFWRFWNHATKKLFQGHEETSQIIPITIIMEDMIDMILKTIDIMMIRWFFICVLIGSKHASQWDGLPMRTQGSNIIFSGTVQNLILE